VGLAVLSAEPSREFTAVRIRECRLLQIHPTCKIACNALDRLGPLAQHLFERDHDDLGVGVRRVGRETRGCAPGCTAATDTDRVCRRRAIQDATAPRIAGTSWRCGQRSPQPGARPRRPPAVRCTRVRPDRTCAQRRRSQTAPFRRREAGGTTGSPRWRLSTRPADSWRLLFPPGARCGTEALEPILPLGSVGLKRRLDDFDDGVAAGSFRQVDGRLPYWLCHYVERAAGALIEWEPIDRSAHGLKFRRTGRYRTRVSPHGNLGSSHLTPHRGWPPASLDTGSGRRPSGS